MRLLAQESVYWVNMNTDTGNTIKQCSTCLEYAAYAATGEKQTPQGTCNAVESGRKIFLWSMMKICCVL